LKYIVSFKDKNIVICSKKELYKFMNNTNNKDYDIHEIIQTDIIFSSDTDKKEDFIKKNSFCNIKDCMNYCNEMCYLPIKKQNTITPNTKNCAYFKFDELPF
jgi:hypothetical protein